MSQKQSYFVPGEESRIAFKKHTPEEIMGKLRQAEIVLAQGTLMGVPVDGLGLANRSIFVGETNMGV